jgi:hypothetical protein
MKWLTDPFYRGGRLGFVAKTIGGYNEPASDGLPCRWKLA